MFNYVNNYVNTYMYIRYINIGVYESYRYFRISITKFFPYLLYYNVII